MRRFGAVNAAYRLKLGAKRKDLYYYLVRYQLLGTCFVPSSLIKSSLER